MAKKFTANCDFGGKVVPITFYVGNPAVNSHPLGFQSKWLGKERGGNVPPDIMDSFGKLKEIADKNKVSFEDLCEYVIAELNSAENLQKDVSKATAISAPEESKLKNSESKKSSALKNEQQAASTEKKSVENKPINDAQQNGAKIPSVKQKAAGYSVDQSQLAYHWQQNRVGVNLEQEKSFAEAPSQNKTFGKQQKASTQYQEGSNSSNN